MLFSLCVYIGLSVWLSKYTKQSFKISRNAYLDMDICGNESVLNMQEFTKINISNFSFLAGALLCKLLTCALMLISVMDLLGKNTGDSSHSFVRVLDATSFVFLLVACSLQLYKWIMIILRVQYFGGVLSRQGYRIRIVLGRNLFIILATLFPLVILIMIFVDSFTQNVYI